jgi:hypothetical protein
MSFLGGSNMPPLPGFMGPGAQGTPDLSQYNLYPGLTPQYGQIAQGMINDPSSPFFQGGAYGAAGYGAGAASNAYGTGAQMLGLMNPIIQAGYDPQSALYSQLRNQTQSSALANLSNAGLATTPYGQSVLGTDLSNFDINWQNQQLARMTQAAQAAGAAGVTGTTMMGQAPGLAYQSAMYPWQANQAIGGANMSALGQLGAFGAQGAAIPQQMQQNYMGALNAYNQMQQNYFADAMQQQQANAQQQSAMMRGLGTIGGAALGAFGGPAGMMAGASLGGSMFGGGGGGTPNYWGGSPFAGLPTNWNFLGGGGGGYFPSNYAVYQYGGEPTPGQPAMVGEEGPEMFIPHVPGTIVPNPQTQQRMAGMGGMGQMGGGMMPTPGGPTGMMPLGGPTGVGGVPPGMGGLGDMGQGFRMQGGGRGWNYGGGY